MWTNLQKGPIYFFKIFLFIVEMMAISIYFTNLLEFFTSDRRMAASKLLFYMPL